MADTRLPASEVCSLLRDLKSEDLLSVNSVSMTAVDRAGGGRGGGHCNRGLPGVGGQKGGSSGADLTLCSDEVRSTTGEQIPMWRPFGATADAGCRSLLLEADVQLCRLHHSRSLIRKILICGCRRRWRTRHVLLGTEEIAFLEPSGSLDFSVPYCAVDDVTAVPFWKKHDARFRINVSLNDSLLILQTGDLILRNQLLHSLQWKRCASKFDKSFANSRSAESTANDFKQMIDLICSSPLDDDSMHKYPLDVLSEAIHENADDVTKTQSLEEMVSSLGPLLELNRSSQPLFEFFSKYCRHRRLSSSVLNLFTPLVHRILKHSMDFGKYPRKRLFVQEFIEALRSDHSHAVWHFIRSVHGPLFVCPHLRILPNMVSVCLATVYSYYEEKKKVAEDDHSHLAKLDQKLITYLTMMQTMSEYEDWRPHVASLLQPIPFPDDALVDDFFTLNMKSVLLSIADDEKCDVHRSVLGVCDKQNGWFDVYCPRGTTAGGGGGGGRGGGGEGGGGGGAADGGGGDDGELYAVMLKRLVGCCCRRKQFLQLHQKMTSAWIMMALRENAAAIDTLLALLEYELCEEDAKVKDEVISALKGTPSGQRVYFEFCQQQLLIKVIQQKGGPVKLTLPSKFTDSDLAKLLRTGSFGNLECLSLAFTQVTSACAKDIVKLRSLRYLSLWCTQFGDAGLRLLTEHLPMLQALNLCETSVTDSGLRCLAALKNLRRLNLNSTHLSARTFEALKEQLPLLQEYDIRYTDAW